ncbi:MAG: ribonuclease R [Clostridia bacterium]|nr:ribonuclease R [Clostridia bacterium]
MRRYKNKKHFHKTPKKLPAVEGTLSCSPNGGFGFVNTDGDSPDIFVDSDMFGGANHGDRVSVRPIRLSRGEKRTEGRIIKVLERNITRLTAVVFADFGGTLAARADDVRYYPVIHIPYDATLGAKKGDRVAVELVAFDYAGQPEGAVVQNLGSADSIKSKIDSIVFSHSIKTEFDEETISESEKISDTIPESEIEKRLDLRAEKIITIDGDDAKDFDDAISIRKLGGNMYRLGVHIADVSHYVTPNSAIDNEAFARGTSVYLPDRVIPMLPERLSNGVCSLVPNEDRLTLSCIMTVTADGDVKNYKIVKSVIRSMHRMTYTEVDKILSGDKALKKQYSDILTQLGHMDTLCDILTAKRKKRGSIDFDLPETKVMLGKDYSIGEITARERLKSHKIIEEFMLLANETVARHGESRGIPLIYRTHAAPDPEKLESFALFLHNFGLTLPEMDTGITPKALQGLLDKISDEPYQAIVSKNMLRAMMKAEYRPTNDGHFGLAAEYYCHFTSPIRRYPDLMVHRALSNALVEKQLAMDCREASVQSTETERNAEECERDTTALLKVLYIKEHIGEEFGAVITSLTDYGIYAELDNTIEGMIRLESIGGDYYVYNEKRAVTVGKRTGKAFKIGDRLEVVVTGANSELLRVDFMLKRDFYRRDKNAV